MEPYAESRAKAKINHMYITGQKNQSQSVSLKPTPVLFFFIFVLILVVKFVSSMIVLWSS